MAKEKIYIVLSHIHSLKKDPRTTKCIAGEWEVSEKVEFVNQLKTSHTTTSTAVADYINKKMLSGSRFGMSDYSTFLGYVYTKYPKQMQELDEKYGQLVIPDQSTELEPELITDQFGNVRAKTVFDLV